MVSFSLYVDSDCFKYDMDFPGNDIKFATAKNISACQIECQQHIDCKFWSFNTASDGSGPNCWLKTKDDYKSHRPDRTSGPKHCGNVTQCPISTGLAYNIYQTVEYIHFLFLFILKLNVRQQ